MQAIVQGLATTYERTGTGRQILILHGWADDSRSWRAFAHELSKSYEVVVPDLPGFGGTEAPHEVWGLSEYADFVSDFIRKTGLKPYAVIGHSNGGAIAIKSIARGLLAPGKLVLLASAGIRTEARGRKQLLKVVAKTGKAATLPLPVSTREKLRRKLYKASGSDMLIAEHLQETFKQVVSEDVRNDASRVAMPTFLLYGKQDTSTPPRYGALLVERMQHARLETLPAAGHFIQLDAPGAVVQKVEEFLK